MQEGGTMKVETVGAVLKCLQKGPLRLALIAIYLKILQGKTISLREFEELIEVMMEAQEKIKKPT